jgi:membrane protein
VSKVGDLKTSATTRWQQARLEHYWIDHVVRAWQRFQANNASQYAAAITYFSFLALFPLILLGVSVIGFVLNSDPHLRTQLFDNITKHFSGSLGDSISTSINDAIKARTSVGIVGILGVLLTGLGWIGNLRQAINGVWGTQPPKRNFVMSKVSNLIVLGGLGLGIVVSLGVTAAGTAVTDQIVSALGLGSNAGIHVLLTLASVVVGVVGDVLIFGWLLIRLPKGQVSRKIAWRTSLLAAIGFEILKQVGTYTIAKSAKSPTLGPFASILALLIWIQLVARFMLFCAAWSATSTPIDSPVSTIPPITLTVPAERTRSGPSPVSVAASLFGAGTAFGVGLVSYLRRGRAR